MSLELVIASSAITAALAFYTVGVFAERRAGSLKLSHVLLFWAGLVCDTTGTAVMTNIAQTSGAAGFGIHAVSGMLAIALMLVHAIWATATYVRHNERAEKTFHTFSTFVWLLWLVPYIIGMLVGIPAIHLQTVCAVGTSVIVVAAFAFVLLRRDFSRRSH
ncbi:MAG: HsmA family protein [Slackia sp.]|nr:HsmA family protein [Slackia sp.]